MILENVNSLLQEYENYENTPYYYSPVNYDKPSFLSRHKGKLLAGALLAGGGALAAAGYKGKLGPGIQKSIADTAFRASTKVAKSGAKLALSGQPKFVRNFGQEVAKLGTKSTISTGAQALRAREGEFLDKVDKFSTAHKRLKDLYDTAKQQINTEKQ